MTCSSRAGSVSISSAEVTDVPDRISPSSIRLMTNDTPGGIDAVIEISAIRYGDFLSRSDAFVFSWSAVALMTSSARVAGSIFSTTVAMPLRAWPIASFACLLRRSCMAGSWADRLTSVALVRAASAACWALPAAASAASRGSLQEAHARSLASDSAPDH